MATKLKFIDIGANLLDDMFQGIYKGKKSHESDIDLVLKRAFNAGLQKIIVTAGYLNELKNTLKLIQTYEQLHTTVGVHPTRCSEFENNGQNADLYMNELVSILKDDKNNKISAIGEFGLDYDRLEFCPKEIQQKYFEKQFILAEVSGKPLFLHMRNAADDFINIVKRNRNRFKNGVVHSFTGSLDDATKILSLDLFIGINGCSLKSEENLKVVAQIPNDRIILETDAPYCDIRATHAGFKFVKTNFLTVVKHEKFEMGFCVKNRNEPCHITQILEVVAGVKNENPEQLACQIYENTCNVFFPNIIE